MRKIFSQVIIMLIMLTLTVPVRAESIPVQTEPENVEPAEAEPEMAKPEEAEQVKVDPVEFALRKLKSKDMNVQIEGIYILGELGDEAVVAIPDLILKTDIVNETKPVASEAVSALVKIGDPAVKPLIKALSHEKKGIVSGAFSALTKIGDYRATLKLIDVLGEKRDFNNLWMIPAFEKMLFLHLWRNEKAKELVPDLTKILNEDYGTGNKRELAAWTLAVIGDQQASEPLTDYLRSKSEDGIVQGDPIEILWFFGDKKTVESVFDILVNTLKNGKGNGKREAARLLISIDEKELLDRFIDARKTDNRAERETIFKYIKGKENAVLKMTEEELLVWLEKKFPKAYKTLQ